MNARITHADGTVTEHTKKTQHAFTHAVVEEGSPQIREWARLDAEAKALSAEAGPIRAQLDAPQILVRRDLDVVVSAEAGYVATLVGTELTLVCGDTLQTAVFVDAGAGLFQKTFIPVLAAITAEVEARAKASESKVTELIAARDAIDLDNAVPDSWSVFTWSIRDELAVAAAADMNSRKFDRRYGGRALHMFVVRPVDVLEELLAAA